MWSFWHLFPRWLKLLTLLVGLPAWLGFAFIVFTGSIFEYQAATLALFGVFGLLAVCQTTLIARAAWRNDL
jgi:hypothetical protein